MKAEGSRGKAIAESNLDHIILGYAGRCKQSGHQFAPVFQVIARVSDDTWVFRCAGRRMNPHHFSERNGKHLVRIGIGKIMSCGERKEGGDRNRSARQGPG